MSIEEVVALLLAELKDDIIGTVSNEGDTITLAFTDGSELKIIVE